MKIFHLFVVSRRVPEWLSLLEADYIRRLGLFRLSVSVVKPALSAEKEAKALMAKLPPQAQVVLLTDTGESLDSLAFAKRISLWMEERTPPVFVICGADGAPDEIRQRSTYQLSLSMMTFSHTTARLVLVEQFFRADCILRGHPYPR